VANHPKLIYRTANRANESRGQLRLSSDASGSNLPRRERRWPYL